MIRCHIASSVKARESLFSYLIILALHSAYLKLGYLKRKTDSNPKSQSSFFYSCRKTSRYVRALTNEEVDKTRNCSAVVGGGWASTHPCELAIRRLDWTLCLLACLERHGQSENQRGRCEETAGEKMWMPPFIISEKSLMDLSANTCSSDNSRMLQ